MYFCRNISRCINLRLHWVSIFVHKVVLKFLSHTRTLKLKMLFIMFELDRVFFNYVSFYKIPQSFFVRKNKGGKMDANVYTHIYCRNTSICLQSSSLPSLACRKYCRIVFRKKFTWWQFWYINTTWDIDVLHFCYQIKVKDKLPDVLLSQYSQDLTRRFTFAYQ